MFVKLIVTLGVTCVDIEDIMIFPLEFCIVMKANHHKKPKRPRRVKEEGVNSSDV